MRDSMAANALSPVSAKKLKRRVVVAETGLAEAERAIAKQRSVNQELEFEALRLQRQAAKQLRSFDVAIDDAEQKLKNTASALQRAEQKRDKASSQNSELRRGAQQKEAQLAAELKELRALANSLSGVQTLGGLLTALLPAEDCRELEGSIPTQVCCVVFCFVELC